MIFFRKAKIIGLHFSWLIWLVTWSSGKLRGGASTPLHPLLFTMLKSRESNRYLLLHKSMFYVQIHFGKTYVHAPSKILFLIKDSNFNFYWAFKTWQTSDPPKVVAATFEIFNGLNIHSYVSQPFRLHYYNAHLRNLHWNAHFLYFSASPFFLPCIAKSSTDSVTHWFMNW